MVSLPSERLGTLTGHYIIHTHAVNLRTSAAVSVNSCLNEKEVAKSQHFLLDCSAYARSWRERFGAHTFRDLAEVVGIQIKRLN